MFPERKHNYPEGYKKGPTCPFTEIVRIGASLAGYELGDPETFCYEEIENSIFVDGTPGYVKGYDYSPVASCNKVYLKLLDQFRIVNQEIKTTPNITKEKEISEALKNKRFEVINNLSRSYMTEYNTLAKKQEIIDRWRQVVFENFYPIVYDEKSKTERHFGGINSANELTESLVIDTVKNFHNRLRKVTNREDREEGCSQAPSSGHIGAYH